MELSKGDVGDLVVGTGVGAVLAAMLFADDNFGRPLFTDRDVVNLVAEKSSELFNARAVGVFRRGQRYSGGSMDKALTELLTRDDGKVLTLKDTCKPLTLLRLEELRANKEKDEAMVEDEAKGEYCCVGYSSILGKSRVITIKLEISGAGAGAGSPADEEEEEIDETGVEPRDIDLVMTQTRQDDSNQASPNHPESLAATRRKPQ
ncbi:hypothetical protein ACLB2K_075216 [Fragaria x ananassa]